MPRVVRSLDKMDVHVGERVKMRRSELGMTQAALADTLGLSFQQVQKYERGVNRIASSRLQMIADTLHVTPTYFFDGLPEYKAIKGSQHSLDHIKKFAASADGMALMKAFRKISRSDVRRRIVALVESLAGPES